ncbi:hypothetical protein L198_07078 [Cryptococcus wingfieldii CBS 7118]|uniref:Uncharacterized protein n=1 Tax=Cryptococcus wingfieldii CBS 7118 TaxID=1295528 RepID=A0A1E3II96_9TREE|nr:hypothetical protein L198_07078 [Cryptococcus wingfieldii CBS 7118]ODN87451.1 hypothetical protein L198_07078 [Cryptococcus wingfieldii CBS 7118]
MQAQHADLQRDLQRGQLDPPKLPILSSPSASPLGVVSHLQDLDRYFDDYASRFPNGDRTSSRWQVTQANRSIANIVSYQYWSMATGAACTSWDHWRREFKKKALSEDWEADMRREFEGLKCDGTSLGAWQRFEEKAGECQMVLRQVVRVKSRPGRYVVGGWGTGSATSQLVGRDVVVGERGGVANARIRPVLAEGNSRPKDNGASSIKIMPILVDIDGSGRCRVGLGFRFFRHHR